MASVIAWILAHKVLMSAAAVAVLDFLFAINPSIDASGILHQIYLWLKPAPKLVIKP